MSDPTIIQDILDQALARLKRQGWLQYTPKTKSSTATDNRPLCIAEAIALATKSLRLPMPQHDALVMAAQNTVRHRLGLPLFPHTCSALIRWNDDPARTFADIEAALCPTSNPFQCG